MLSLLLAAALAADVTVTTSDNAIRDAVASHHGSPVLVQFWATWCDACMHEFPHFLRLAKTPGLKVVSVSVDLKQGLERHVRPFLEREHVEFPTVLLDVDSPERVMRAIDPTWNGSIPAGFLYDKEGKLVRRFLGDGGAAIDKAVNALTQ
jgi:thiol-disulfide isomerase/thioredoxin